MSYPACNMPQRPCVLRRWLLLPQPAIRGARSPKRWPMSPNSEKTPLQLFAAQEFTCKCLGNRKLPENFPYLDENKEFQGGGGGGSDRADT